MLRLLSSDPDLVPFLLLHVYIFEECVEVIFALEAAKCGDLAYLQVCVQKHFSRVVEAAVDDGLVYGLSNELSEVSVELSTAYVELLGDQIGIYGCVFVLIYIFKDVDYVVAG